MPAIRDIRQSVKFDGPDPIHWFNGPSKGPLVGISTDLYFPPLEDLLRAFSDEGEFSPEYIEIFRGRTPDLVHAREIVPDNIPLSYHGDCLWYTQVDFPDNPAYRDEILRANRHMKALGAPWMIHECAQKTMEGYAFGLYAPPLLTREGALAARKGALALFGALNGRLLLVETPPFPPHPTGLLDLSLFFRIMTVNTGLGIGLDIGHCLTYLAASGRKTTPHALVEWLRDFPLERVVEIHVGGLDPMVLEGKTWPVDDHSRPVPDLLFDALESVCQSFSMPNLKGIALEVDNKEIPQIVREYGRFRSLLLRVADAGLPGTEPEFPIASPPTDLEEPSGHAAGADRSGLVREGYRNLALSLARGEDSPYARVLYADEIWHFGGSMPDLFPETLFLLEKEGLCVRSSFVDFFNRFPRSETTPYDYLKIKIHRTLDWVDSLSETIKDPSALATVQAVAGREAGILLSAQEQFNGDPL